MSSLRARHSAWSCGRRIRTLVIRAIDASAALRKPNVLTVPTGRDVARVAASLACVIPPSAYGRTDEFNIYRPILAVDRVRHVGDGVAFVVAATQDEACEAARLIKVDYVRLPDYVDPIVALSKEPNWADAPDNLAFDWRFGDSARCKELFAEAAHVVAIKVELPRLNPNPIEPRGAIGLYDPQSDSFTLVSNPQGVHFVRGVLAQALRLPEERLRVVAP